MLAVVTLSYYCKCAHNGLPFIKRLNLDAVPLSILKLRVSGGVVVAYLNWR